MSWEWDRIRACWPTVRREAKAKWPKLSDSDLDIIAGDRAALCRRVADQYGLEEEDAAGAIDEWFASLPEECASGEPDLAELDQERSEGEGMGQGRYTPPPRRSQTAPK
jgi:uncharacterized protein YjbJ (UPF0337 family)